MLFQAALIGSFFFSPLACNSASCYGQEASQGIIDIFGDPDEFVTSWQDEIKPMINEWMGAGVAIAGFSLVLKALIK